MAAKVCLERPCPNLRPCAVHPPRVAASRNHNGVSRHVRGHGADHDRARRAFAGRSCALNLPGCTRVATSSDYIVPLSRGGRAIAGNRQPACSHCQRVQGGLLAAASR